MPFLSEADQDELRGLDQDLHLRFNVMDVPNTVINGVEELVGAQPEARMVAAVRTALSHQKGTDA